MVQTLEQYILVHRAVKELFLEQMRVIDSHPYENVDDDGHPLVDNKEDTDYETVVVSFYQSIWKPKLAKTETIYPKNVRAKVAMDFT